MSGASERTAGCLVALALLPGLGPATLRRCHLEHGAEDAWAAIVRGRPERVPAVAEQLARSERRRPGSGDRLVEAARRLDPVEVLARQVVEGRRFHVLGAPDYPPRLAGDQAAPAVVFSCGDLDLLERRTVALVGTRNATLAGRRLAETVAGDLAAAGVVVVSGLALGIDGAAHRGVVVSHEPGAPLPAVGVVASGLDVVYPRRHADLHAAVARHGLLISETPAGLRPDAWRFPARNRIIAALADAVVVVESRATGGSMHTVEEALARDVPVLAVPGHPSAPASAGTNALLFDGAGMARDAADVLLAIGVEAPRPLPGAGGGGPEALSPAERSVLEVVSTTPSSLAEVVAATGRTVEEVAHLLIALETSGRLQRTGAWYEATPSQGDAR